MDTLIYIPGVKEDKENGLWRSLSAIEGFDLMYFAPWNSTTELETHPLVIGEFQERDERV